jgi:ZIP family zinc transporter
MLDAILVSFIVQVLGTGLGGLIAVIIGKCKKVNDSLFSFTAGIMLAIVCFELIPDAISFIDVLFVCIAVIIGSLAINFFENILSKNNDKKKSLFMIGLAIALHNFPEGLVLGASNQKFSALSLLIGLHNIPEGVAVCLPYFQNGEKGKGILYSFLSGAPTVLGAVIGNAFSSISPVVSGVCLAFASGAMIYVVFSELIPRSNDLLKEKISGIILTIGVIIGLIVINLF